jgi:polyisoprenoid-binding protein YceI
MKNKTLLILAAAVTIAGAFAFGKTQNRWTVNTKESKIDFTLPKGKHSGTVSGLDASIDFDPKHPELAAIKATVNVNELKADNEQLTAHLMTADFFDAANHPQITFTAEQVTKNDTGYVATGKLALRDSVHTVNIPFSFSKQGKKAATMKGRLNIFAGDYGIGKKSKEGNDLVIVNIEVPLTK